MFKEEVSYEDVDEFSKTYEETINIVFLNNCKWCGIEKINNQLIQKQNYKSQILLHFMCTRCGRNVSIFEKQYRNHQIKISQFKKD